MSPPPPPLAPQLSFIQQQPAPLAPPSVGSAPSIPPPAFHHEHSHVAHPQHYHHQPQFQHSHQTPPETQPRHMSLPTPPTHVEKPSPSPTFTLSQTDTALLSETYTDFLLLLRQNPQASNWILPWATTHQPTHVDATNINLSLSRGFRGIHMCAANDCASSELGPRILQKASTLLLPVQSQDSLVLGYFLDSAIDAHSGTAEGSSSSPALRTGRYVYSPVKRELLKVSKVRGPASGASFSVCISRTSLVGAGMFITDHVLASFPCQHNADDRSDNTVPSRCIAHVRSLTFHKLVQSGAGGASTGGNVGVMEHSFYGLGAFGVYECAFVPARLGFGAVGEIEGGRVGLALGNWAVPEHAAYCRGLRLLQLGVLREEVEALRMQFVQIYGHVGVSGGVGRSDVGGNEGTPSFVGEGEDHVVLYDTKASGNEHGSAATGNVVVEGLVDSGNGTRNVEELNTNVLGIAEREVKSMDTFKKTLPAPTKSEIVIRNRISAQRSNEKRRRKIEATKSELAFLKSTYLPQLEVKRGSLISENQTLRLRFMEKYQHSDIDSFF